MCIGGSVYVIFCLWDHISSFSSTKLIVLILLQSTFMPHPTWLAKGTQSYSGWPQDVINMMSDWIWSTHVCSSFIDHKLTYSVFPEPILPIKNEDLFSVEARCTVDFQKRLLSMKTTGYWSSYYFSCRFLVKGLTNRTHPALSISLSLSLSLSISLYLYI